MDTSKDLGRDSMNIKRYGFGVAFSILCSLGAVEAIAADIITPLGNDAVAGARAPARQVTAHQLARRRRRSRGGPHGEPPRRTPDPQPAPWRVRAAGPG